MCGIAAIFPYRATADAVDRDELRRIRERLRSRGPDGEGEWISPDRRIGLAHTRLAIIDLSDAASQPMWTSDGSLGIVFNGEIYNYRELRAGLERDGARFATESDTEVVLELYRARAGETLDSLRGMFAFMIVDRRANELFLARDAYGIKPLYWSNENGVFRAASQVKALLAGDRVSRAIDPAGLASFYLMGSVMGPFTIHEAIRALPAGTTMRVTHDGPSEPRPFTSIASIWSAASVPRGAGNGEREALLESVRYHLVSDVPVGVFLSAGIDSSAILALATDARTGSPNGPAPNAHHPLSTLTLAFEEFAGTPDDESPIAAETAKRYGATHTTRVITASELEGDLDRFLDAMDQPTIDGVNTWFVSKAARELGWKVALSGLGGDELFGGYPSFREIPRLVSIARRVGAIPGLPRAFRTIARNFSRSRPKLPGLLELGRTWAGAYLLRRGLYMPWELASILGDDFAEEGLRRLDILSRIELELPRAPSPVPRLPFPAVSALESSLYMRNQLLRDTDWAAMAHSLEVRVPLVDPWLLRRLAPSFATGSSRGKDALADAASLPVALASRPKTGFSVPMGHWIGARDASNRGLAMRQWAMKVIERWKEIDK